MIGWLLVNLGSPEHPTTPAVRRYLRQFLMDKHVIDLHWSVRSVLVHGWIAPKRAPKSAHAYRAIWTDEGSPLLLHSRNLLKKIKEERPDVAIEMGMRYGRPSLRSALDRLRERKIDSLKVVPMYPQFAKSSSLTGMEAVLNELKRMNWTVETQFLQDFFEHPAWIRNLAQNIVIENQNFNADFLLMSYHGLPEHHMHELDKTKKHCLTSGCCEVIAPVNRRCYRAQCYATSRALLRQLGWPSAQQQVSFQSRLGRRPWIKPYSDHVIVELAKRGVKRVLVTCPSFVADCLETLEEVAIRMKSDFLAAGGEDLRLVPALNDQAKWIADFAEMLDDDRLTWLSPKEVERVL